MLEQNREPHNFEDPGQTSVQPSFPTAEEVIKHWTDAEDGYEPALLNVAIQEEQLRSRTLNQNVTGEGSSPGLTPNEA